MNDINKELECMPKFIDIVNEITRAHAEGYRNNEFVINVNIIEPEQTYMDKSISILVPRFRSSYDTLHNDVLIKRIETGRHEWIKTLLNDNLIVCGGFLQQYASYSMEIVSNPKMLDINDIDLYHIHDDPTEETLLEQCNIVGRKLAIQWSGTHIRVFRTNHAITFMSSDEDQPKVQIMLKKYRTIADVLFSFDLGSCMLAWNGGMNVKTTKMGRFAYKYHANIVNLEATNEAYPDRVAKYFGRDFGLVVPNFLAIVETYRQHPTNEESVHSIIVIRSKQNGSRFRVACDFGITMLSTYTQRIKNMFNVEMKSIKKVKWDAMHSSLNSHDTYSHEYNYRDWNEIVARNMMILRAYQCSIDGSSCMGHNHLNHLVSCADYADGMDLRLLTNNVAYDLPNSLRIIIENNWLFDIRDIFTDTFRRVHPMIQDTSHAIVTKDSILDPVEEYLHTHGVRHNLLRKNVFAMLNKSEQDLYVNELARELIQSFSFDVSTIMTPFRMTI
jgi:hypothetical protein